MTEFSSTIDSNIFIAIALWLGLPAAAFHFAEKDKYFWILLGPALASVMPLYGVLMALFGQPGGFLGFSDEMTSEGLSPALIAVFVAVFVMAPIS